MTQPVRCFGLALLLLAALGTAYADPRYNVIDLGTLGEAGTSQIAINAAGQVTGSSAATGNAGQHVFLYSDGVMTDLGTLGGTNGEGNAINNAGQITGSADTSFGSRHAFLYSDGVMTDLGSLGGTFSIGLAINDAGQITGVADTTGTTFPHAFLYSDRGMTDLGTLRGRFSIGLAINDAGQVTGYSETPLLSGTNDIRPIHAFLFSDGVMTDLGSLRVRGDSIGVAINAAGQVTGWTDVLFAIHAFLFSNRVMTDLGTLGGTFSRGKAINNAGQITGSADTTAHFDTHAFLYSNGVMTDLGTLGGTFSSGEAINAAGQVIGYSNTTGNAGRHAFLYSDGVMTDLNTVIPAGSGWTLEAGRAMNDNGQIIGDGTINGERHAFLLIPVAYNFVGFLPPVDNPSTVNLATAGQTLAEQWQLFDVHTGAPISDPSSVTALTTYRVACGAWSDAPTDGLDQVSAGASGLQYLGNGTWQFNWKTDKSWANTCRTAVLTLNDGSTYSAWLQFKK